MSKTSRVRHREYQIVSGDGASAGHVRDSTFCGFTLLVLSERVCS